MLKCLKIGAICMEIGVIIGASILDCITIFYLVALFFKFDQNIMDLMIITIVAVIFISVLFLIAYVILTKVIPQKDTGGLVNKVIQVLKVVSLMMFFAYAFCSEIQTRNIVRGSDIYMCMTDPGIIPLIADALLYGIKG